MSILIKDTTREEREQIVAGKPIIGIVARPSKLEDGGKEVMNIHEGYRMSVIRSGGIPIAILPPQDICYENVSPADAPWLNEEEREMFLRQLKMCDGFVFPGGHRIYDYDMFVARYAVENDIPTLGICMGMQLLAVASFPDWEAGDVLKRIQSEIVHMQPEKDYVHSVNVVDGTKFKSIVGQDTIRVNSRHNYGVTKVNNLTVSAISEDGVIEGIEYDDKKFIVGVQWHPEDMTPYDESARKLFDAFIKACN